MALTDIQMDRAVGAIVASAVGDALGAPYEFKPPLPDTEQVVMHAGGGWELGEWTDDTAMAIPILRELAAGNSLDDGDAIDRILAAWHGWSLDAKDVGNQTRSVFGLMADDSEAAARAAAKEVHDRTGRSGGNGSLMRTGPVALGYLDDPDGLARAARRISDLTHFDDDAGDACVLWSEAIRHAIVTGELDLRGQLQWLVEERRSRWSGIIDEAEAKDPWDFPQNGWVVQALQAAWSAIWSRGETPPLDEMLPRAVRTGFDTDTVAAIAGALGGAAHGASDLPLEWRRHLHGWAGGDVVGCDDTLTRLAALAARGGETDSAG